mmetsp:Transcript_19768/g.57365  ORF Transcript_19768/g.57365 Transcript_19768/m.57365 type:complete len:126 (+) Transcript_19768:112-489(+)
MIALVELLATCFSNYRCYKLNLIWSFLRSVQATEEGRTLAPGERAVTRRRQLAEKRPWQTDEGEIEGSAVGEATLGLRGRCEETGRGPKMPKRGKVLIVWRSEGNEGYSRERTDLAARRKIGVTF